VLACSILSNLDLMSSIINFIINVVDVTFKLLHKKLLLYYSNL